LFGTVLGVMAAFVELKKNTPEAQEKTLDLIAEALSATAFGLLVAIPAVVAFNYFTRRLKVMMTGADECAHQVLSLVHAQLGTPAMPSPKQSLEGIPAPKDMHDLKDEKPAKPEGE
jgi:biopolymer transport protein ExbB/TolQ